MAAPVGPKKVNRYTLEFKIQAVRLANHPEIETQEVAHALDTADDPMAAGMIDGTSAFIHLSRSR